MNQKTIKEHLKSFRELEREVKREIESAEYWKRKAYTLSAVNFDNMGITGSQRTDNGSLVIKFLEIQERCVFLAEEAQRQKEEIMGIIAGIDDPDCREVLAMRYIDGLSFERIAKELNYSIRWVFNKHSQGLKKIQSCQDVQ